MARTPDEYIAHIFLSSGHHQEVRFDTIQAFQEWYIGDIERMSSSNNFVDVPISSLSSEHEYMMVRPASIVAIRVEPIFAGSVGRDQTF
ncbi:MAG: hypothetical protein AAFY11_05995 [Cyanobacteria bacterium J06641_5]